ncbi:hypothetical protein AWM68_01910 [Fictibacillus phosphorivorans]|uniref:ABC transmembrane type-1 domain-containing protein n=1 Tax=Fictibacillus phosphorivorans TaxID=1221500 RepID=A0A161RWL2_9BACL|nr:ABC transporter permease subunit [Fictibacillus phosphorivorans]KZE69046.1 hypothetical protein AWM68_01910 [Fictibacillus phosphorivorans]
MFKRVFLNPFFLSGFLFLTLVFIGSFVYTYWFAESIQYSRYLYNSEGLIIDMAPFPPSLDFPIGTDKDGKQMIFILLEGAKFTIGIALGLAFIRILAGTIMGVIFYLLPNKLLMGIKSLVDSYHYAPVVIFAFLLLSPAYIAFNWAYDFDELFYYTLFVLAFLGVPILALYVAEEIRGVYNLEFIKNASLLGGSKCHILWKHVKPYLIPKLCLLFVQQISQLLNLLAHLAMLQIFFGGTKFILMEQENTKGPEGSKVIEAFSNNNEWAGLLGKSWASFITFPWIVFGSVIAIALTVLATNLMAEGIRRVTGLEPVKIKKNKQIPSEQMSNKISFEKLS